ncbi:PAS domain-containing protein [Desulfobulbus alkaliphilus]|uniref:PAS domain-containing protein n=1 Tax=Desulfobulbus alkaliphilus TaxID=869814 RepID=UPI001963F155|nr:PAS domain-containing protein [Desulfobulbus alkaliphilus]MBM9536713.1 PAS domain S-box protein [Desulfobulbus alkaliphilus]
MKLWFKYQHITLPLLVTLILAGLFYLPYLSVRNKTIETHRAQQFLLSRQASTALESFFSTYEKALAYLIVQPSIRDMQDSGKVLLEDFLSIRTDDIVAVQRTDAQGSLLFSLPAENSKEQDAVTEICRRQREHPAPMVSDLISSPGQEDRIYISAAVPRGQEYDGCLSFQLPFQEIFSHSLQSFPVQPDGYVLLISGEGTILHAPDPQLLVGLTLDQLPGKSEDLANLRRKLLNREQAILLFSDNILIDPQGFSGKMFASIYPVQLPGPEVWSIVAVTPAREVLGAMADFRSQWLVVTVVALVTIGLLGMLLGGITARRQEEQELRVVKEHLVGLLDLVPMGVFLVDKNSVIAYANQSAADLVEGTSVDQVIGRLITDFLHSTSREPLVSNLDKPATSAVDDKEAILLTLNNNQRDIVMTTAPYRLGDQEHRTVIIRNVTEERKAEERRRLLTEAVEQVKEAVLIADRSGIVDYVNNALVEMTGYHREECLGRPMRLFWAKEQEAHFDEQMKVVIQGEVWRGRIVNRRRDSSLFVAGATVSPVRDSNSVVTHFIVVQRDITHDVEVESRMRQAQKMEAIGTLAGGIAHDFNNILGGIIGFTDLALLQVPPNTDLHNNLLHIRKGGKRAADLVQQILTFSRQSAEEKVPVMVDPLIKESLKLMRATLPSTIAIVQNIEAADAQVLAAPVQIQQVVMNLCANAFYSMREQGGQLTIRLERIPISSDREKKGSASSWVSLVVQDTGQGIDSDVIHHIFTPFFTTKKPGEGTGMGLSVVHGIVRELGGEISVQSSPGKGTTFTVLLPETEEKANNVLKSSEEPLPMGKEHILVVDDEKEILETCRMMLSHFGYIVTTTGDPDKVLDLIKNAEKQVDLVFTDQTMPRRTGIELIKDIHQIYPDIPVILCTGYSDRLNSEIAREAGASDLLMKPVDLRGLAIAVRAALDMKNN